MGMMFGGCIDEGCICGAVTGGESIVVDVDAVVGAVEVVAGAAPGVELAAAESSTSAMLDGPRQQDTSNASG